MFLKKMSRPLSKIPVSIRVTVWFTAVIIFLFSIVLSSAILLEDRYINDSSTEELVSAVEKIYEDPDEFENFDDGIYYIKYNENNEIIAGKIPKDFDLTLAFSIEDINTYQIENKKFLLFLISKAVSDIFLTGLKAFLTILYPTKATKAINKGAI